MGEIIVVVLVLYVFCKIVKGIFGGFSKSIGNDPFNTAVFFFVGFFKIIFPANCSRMGTVKKYENWIWS